MAVPDLRTAIVIAAAVAWACDSPLEPTMLGGTWGGEHVTMSIADSTHLEFDCAHGDVAARLSIDFDGHFDVTGTFTREHGGPVRVEEPPDIHPASYSGRVSDDRMTLTVRLTDTGETIGAFTLIRGTPGRVVKCL